MRRRSTVLSSSARLREEGSPEVLDAGHEVAGLVLGEPEVGDLDGRAVQEQVVGLEVEVDDVHGVQVGEALGGVQRQRRPLAQRQVLPLPPARSTRGSRQQMTVCFAISFDLSTVRKSKRIIW